MKLKVLGFDSWTQGSTHYIRLLEEFRKNNIDLTLIHIGSWGNDKGRPVEEILEGLLVRDISYYNTNNFNKILHIEKPDLVLFLSTGSFSHRAFQRYCKINNIPTINLAHGIVSVGYFEGEDAKVEMKLLSHLRWLLSRAKITIIHVLPIYILSLIRTKALISEWKSFFKDLLSRIYYTDQQVYALDSTPTKACVYVEADVSDAILRYNMKREDIVTVGNPDFIKFDISNNSIGIHLRNKPNKLSDIIYIDCGIMSYGVLFNSRREYANFIIEISNALKEQGYKLLYKIKPHPKEYCEAISALLIEGGVEIIDNVQFGKKIIQCAGCITETSSLGIMCALLGMPVFINKLAPLDKLEYGNIFTNYPRSILLTDINQFSILLENEEISYSKNLTQKWIDENVGPLPAADMPLRITNLILSLTK